MGKGNRGRRGDDDSTREPKDVTRGPKPTREPKDVTREPCVGDDCQRRHKGRKGGRKSRKGDDSTTEAPEEVPALRRALERDGKHKRGKGIDATISNGLVDIAGVTGEVVFGTVDEALESIP